MGSTLSHSIHPRPLPLPHSHTLSRSALCRPRRRHQTLHNFRRPSASAQYAGRPVGLTVCTSVSLSAPLSACLFLSTVRLASCSGHTFNQFTLKHQQLHYVTRRRLYVVPSSLVHCVLVCSSASLHSLSRFRSSHTLALRTTAKCFYFHAANSKFQRETFSLKLKTSNLYRTLSVYHVKSISYYQYFVYSSNKLNLFIL